MAAMMKSNPTDADVRGQVENIEFGFYSDTDVRNRSVLEITSPETMSGKTFLPNGLYDPRLGPHSPFDKTPCPTCACRYPTCPGHFGHVELCVPVYHPLLFPRLCEILTMKCFYCHALRLSARQLQMYAAKFALLNCGKSQQANELEKNMESIIQEMKNDNNNNNNASLLSSRTMAAVDGYLQQILSDNNNKVNMTSYERTLRLEWIKKFVSACKTCRKCHHCGAFSPKIRKVGHNKIFMKFSALAIRSNRTEGLVYQSAITKNDDGYQSDDSANMIQPDDEDDDDEEEEEEDNNNMLISDSATVVSSATTVKNNNQDNNNKITEGDKYLPPKEVQAQIMRTWKLAPFLLDVAFGGGEKDGYKIFFIQAVPVPPSRFRPPMTMTSGELAEHTQNVSLLAIMRDNTKIRDAFAKSEEEEDSSGAAYRAWISLQTQVNLLMDSTKGNKYGEDGKGIKQLLEKKEGIFRKHMMGKRVDFACRSVITPDPYIGTREIGIPMYFAKTLTFPTPVTEINIAEMRKLVERGPDVHPGARWIEFPPSTRRVDLYKMDAQKRQAAAARLLTHLNKKGNLPAVVGRHLVNGDMMLCNRQPTLHKPGIMGHYVRILHNPTQKTLRMHYANCNTYNADFDGDEMNCHFPQSFLGRAETQFLTATDLQYIVPTDGSPLRGLIQDHVVGGVKLTKRDTFLEKWEYQQLLFMAMSSLSGLQIIESDKNIELLPPTLIKPRELWTGKQVISTILNHLRRNKTLDYAGISTNRKSKMPSSAFGECHGEHLVLVRDGELLRGVLDKAAFGATDFSLVHAVYEAYGPDRAGLFLNALGRLFTAYVQHYAGHSCRMEDLVLTGTSDDARKKLVQTAYNKGARAARAWANADGGKASIEPIQEDGPLKLVEVASAAAKIEQLLRGSEGKTNAVNLDSYMQSVLNPLSSTIVKECLPSGLNVPFPQNTFGLMVTTGAKGSTVNQSQVSCALGQQALEGRRVPRMSSGRTLPSFVPYDPNPRADGFVMDRFLTGIRPQEYYFHCMAGREGLVDTAVKTSRSGYLQRCLVKHLEELKVCYDNTVRNSEGAVIQFLYGEDGLDPTKAAYLDCSQRSFEYIIRNHESFDRQNPGIDTEECSVNQAARDAETYRKLKDGTAKLEAGVRIKARRLLYDTAEWTKDAIMQGWHDAVILKQRSAPSRFDIRYLKDGHVAKFVPENIKVSRSHHGASLGELVGAETSGICKILELAVPDPVLSSGGGVSERVADATARAMNDSYLKEVLETTGISPERVERLVAAKYANAFCAPGEAVGCIAAQSVGEPSTQMTLNTFHLAGSGANVTLGIPRLREIIMTASKEPKTPTMSVPLHSRVSDKQALYLTRSFTKLTLLELLAGVTVQESLENNNGAYWERSYHVTLQLHPRIQAAFWNLTLAKIAQKVGSLFVMKLTAMMKKEIKRSAEELSLEISTAGVSLGMQDGKDINDKKKQNEDQDDLGEDNEDEDENDAWANDVGEEDGAKMNAVQADSYGEGDDDAARNEEEEEEPSDEAASERSSEDEDEDEKEDDDQKQEEETNNTTELLKDSNTLIDHKNNTIRIQPLRVDPAACPLRMVGLVEAAASSFLIRSAEGISEAYMNEESGGRGRCLQTAGVNFNKIWDLENNIVDHNKLMSNDIWAIRCAFGVEAARANIVQQIKSVFGAYGIEVDPRHLSLIADYMTFDGGYRAMSRTGMVACPSPFLQMSFETTMNFLLRAALDKSSDIMTSPSASIVCGRPMRHGTGSFEVVAKVT